MKDLEYRNIGIMEDCKIDDLVKSPSIVTPAEAGVQNVLK